MTELIEPNREPDFMWYDSKLWFDEMLVYVPYDGWTESDIRQLIMRANGKIGEIKGNDYKEQIQRAYRDWLVEKYLLGDKHE